MLSVFLRSSFCCLNASSTQLPYPGSSASPMGCTTEGFWLEEVPKDKTFLSEKLSRKVGIAVFVGLYGGGYYDFIFEFEYF